MSVSFIDDLSTPFIPQRKSYSPNSNSINFFYTLSILLKEAAKLFTYSNKVLLKLFETSSKIAINSIVSPILSAITTFPDSRIKVRKFVSA